MMLGDEARAAGATLHEISCDLASLADVRAAGATVINCWRIYVLGVYAESMADKALQEPAFLVLTSLAGGPQHGYGLVEDVLRVSDGQVRLHTGTLYAILDRLREGGLIEVDREEIVDSRLRRYYRLT